MKNLKTLLTFIVLAAAVIVGCSKENEEKTAQPEEAIHEIYSGQQGAGTEQPHHFLQLDLGNDGMLLPSNSNDSLAGSGKWKMAGNSFHASFQQANSRLQVNMSGIYDAASNSISGTWGYGNFSIGGGSFYVQKDATKMLTAKKAKSYSMDVLLDRFF